MCILRNRSSPTLGLSVELVRKISIVINNGCQKKRRKEDENFLSLTGRQLKPPSASLEIEKPYDGNILFPKKPGCHAGI